MHNGQLLYTIISKFTIISILIPPVTSTTVGSRAFPVAASLIWNSLPDDIISTESLPIFQRKLKRHLFCQSFPGFRYWHLHLQWTLQWQCHLGHSEILWLIDWITAVSWEEFKGRTCRVSARDDEDNVMCVWWPVTGECRAELFDGERVRCCRLCDCGLECRPPDEPLDTTDCSSYNGINNTEFVQKSDCGFPDFYRTKLLLFETFKGILFIFMWTQTLQYSLLNAEISYTMGDFMFH